MGNYERFDILGYIIKGKFQEKGTTLLERYAGH